jgi:hypothetical protein
MQVDIKLLITSDTCNLVHKYIIKGRRNIGRPRKDGETNTLEDGINVEWLTPCWSLLTMTAYSVIVQLSINWRVKYHRIRHDRKVTNEEQGGKEEKGPLYCFNHLKHDG